MLGCITSLSSSINFIITVDQCSVDVNSKSFMTYELKTDNKCKSIISIARILFQMYTYKYYTCTNIKIYT